MHLRITFSCTIYQMEMMQAELKDTTSRIQQPPYALRL